MAIKFVDLAGLEHYNTKVKEELNNKVEQEDGKGLSTHDLTTELKTKYDEAQANIIDGISVNGVDLAPVSKKVNLSVITGEEVDTKIATAIVDGIGFTVSVVETLPATGEEKNLYLVLRVDATGSDIYDEWLWVNGEYELVGNTSIDLSGYVLSADLVAVTTGEIDALFA